MKVNVIVVATIGLLNGRMRSKKTLNLLDPSICIASSYSLGIEEKNWVNKKILKTDMMLGKITPKTDNVPFSPSICLTMEYKGIILVSTGTTIKKRMIKLKNPFAGKSNFARTYPAKPLTMTLKTITIAAYIKLFKAYFQTS